MLLIPKNNNRNPNLTRYFKDINKLNRISQEEEIKLARKSRNGDIKARNRLIEANLNYAVSAVNKYFHYLSIPHLEKIALANLGLINASERFDERYGYKFITYAKWYIIQAVYKGSHDYLKNVNMPIQLKYDVAKIIYDYMDKHEGVAPSNPYVREKLNEKYGGDSKEQVDFLAAVSYNKKSLETCLDGEGGSHPFLEILEDKNAERPDFEINLESIKQEFDDVIKELNERECKVVEMHYDKGMTFEEIGEEFDMTHEGARLIKENALKKLRLKSKADRLRQYL